MKKWILILIMAVLSNAAFAESSDGIELTGRWKAEAFLTEREDGLLVVPEAYYAFPHLGISEIAVLDSGFIIFQIGGEEFRAFYEPVMLDYDNLHLICSFKDGEQLVLKLAAIEDGWKYLIRIPSDSALFESEADDGDSEDAEAVDVEAVEPDGLGDSDQETAGAAPERFFAGILRKIQ